MRTIYSRGGPRSYVKKPGIARLFLCAAYGQLVDEP